MKKVSIITDDLKKKILEFLYCDEIYNAILIELIQNHGDDFGELHVNETGEGITEILHVKNDGNSDLTNFFCTSKDGLKNIAYKIKEFRFDNVLLAGKLEDVRDLLEMLGDGRTVAPNIFYKLNVEKYESMYVKFQSEIRLANFSSEDVEKVKQCTACFLEAETEEEVKAVTNADKIMAKMKNGVYLLEHKGTPIEMARFIGKTRNFAEITSVYIDEAFRNKGFGKELIAHMSSIAIQEKKTPVLATSASNVAAIRTYESMGFERHGEYAYEFVNML